MTKPRKRKARIRQREALERLAAIKPYLAELERAKVPPLVIVQAVPLIALLLEARR